MQLYDSWVDAGQELAATAKAAYYTALVEYMAYGREPAALKGGAKAVFTAIRPSLDSARASIENGRKGGRPKRGKGKNGNQNPNPDGTQTVTQSEPKPLTKDKDKDKEKGSTPYGVEGKDPAQAFPFPATGRMPQPSEPDVPEPGEVAGYFGANCLRGSAEEFFDFYAAQGWKRGNGMPIEDWRAAARQWGRKQVQVDADRRGRGQMAAADAERASTWRAAETEDEALARLDAQLAAMGGAS